MLELGNDQGASPVAMLGGGGGGAGSEDAAADAAAAAAPAADDDEAASASGTSALTDSRTSPNAARYSSTAVRALGALVPPALKSAGVAIVRHVNAAVDGPFASWESWLDVVSAPRVNGCAAAEVWWPTQ